LEESRKLAYKLLTNILNAEPAYYLKVLERDFIDQEYEQLLQHDHGDGFHAHADRSGSHATKLHESK